MDLKEFKTHEEYNRRHPWELARRDIFRNVLNSHSLLSENTKVLDVGSGDGWLSSNLTQNNIHLTCFDLHYTTEDMKILASLQKSSHTQWCRTIPNEKHDLILALDIVEHTQDDHEFLHSLCLNQMGEGSHALISVPLWPSLYSEHDRRLHHFRRYTHSQIKNLIEQSGLNLIASGDLFHGLVLVRALQKIKEQLFGPNQSYGVSRWNHPDFYTRCITETLKLDSSMPFPWPGLSWWGLCKK